METRGLNFVRYADDCIIMVRSEMSANRVMRNISRFIEEKLGLKVNMTKSKVDRPDGLKYLGFGFFFDMQAQQYKARPHAKSIAKLKTKMKWILFQRFPGIFHCKHQFILPCFLTGENRILGKTVNIHMISFPLKYVGFLP